jgi:plasmid stabilization system protein ParE
MKIRWIGLADKSFEDEIDFIIKKWNTEKADTFILQVKNFLKLLKENPYLGKVSDYRGYRQFVISTQTKI